MNVTDANANVDDLCFSELVNVQGYGQQSPFTRTEILMDILKSFPLHWSLLSFMTIILIHSQKKKSAIRHNRDTASKLNNIGAFRRGRSRIEVTKTVLMGSDYWTCIHQVVRKTTHELLILHSHKQATGAKRGGSVTACYFLRLTIKWVCKIMI